MTLIELALNKNMKQLIQRSQLLNSKFIYQETPEGPQVEAPVAAEVADVPADITPVVEAGAEHACGKGVCLGPDQFQYDQELADDAEGITAEVDSIRNVVEGGETPADPDSLIGEAGDDILTGEGGDEHVTGETGEDTLADTPEEIPETPEAQAEALRTAELAALETQIAEAIASGDTELLAQLNAQKAELEANDPQLEADLADIAENTTAAEFVQTFARMMQGGATASSSPRARTGIHGGVSSTNDSLPSGAATEMFAHAESVAQQLGVETAAVKAVVEVESAGQMDATRFEPHIHARYPNEPEPKRTQLATSYGAFQIMGFNHEVCGFNSPQDMITAMATPEGQLQAFAGFIEGNPRIHNALKAKDWATFASGYNGPAYAQNNYDNKMAAAYARHSRG